MNLPVKVISCATDIYHPIPWEYRQLWTYENGTKEATIDGRNEYEVFRDHDRQEKVRLWKLKQAKSPITPR
jgi:hypothetical protein